MAVVYICDGCNEVTDKADLEQRGIMEMLYCPACQSTADEFLAERDELHDAIQKQWNTGMDKLLSKYHKKIKGRLPDELADQNKKNETES